MSQSDCIWNGRLCKSRVQIHKAKGYPLSPPQDWPRRTRWLLLSAPRLGAQSRPCPSPCGVCTGGPRLPGRCCSTPQQVQTGESWSPPRSAQGAWPAGCSWPCTPRQGCVCKLEGPLPYSTAFPCPSVCLEELKTQISHPAPDPKQKQKRG